MFNIYLAEKRQKIEDEKKKNDQSKIKYDEKRKSKNKIILENLSSLYNNYEKRVKSFLLEVIKFNK